MAAARGISPDKVWLRRRWCPRGERPPWISDERYEWLWVSGVSGAGEPRTGRCCTFSLPRVNPACRQAFLEAFRAETGDERVGRVLDGSGVHQSRAIRWPDGLGPLRLPPDSPELNPAEQIVRSPCGLAWPTGSAPTWTHSTPR